MMLPTNGNASAGRMDIVNVIFHLYWERLWGHGYTIKIRLDSRGRFSGSRTRNPDMVGEGNRERSTARREGCSVAKQAYGWIFLE